MRSIETIQQNSVQAQLKQIYSAGKQTIKVWGMQWFSLVCAAASLWAGYRLFQTFGLAPADGGVLAPLAVRLAWGAGVALLGLAFAAGMLLYGRIYIARMELAADDKSVRLYTMHPFGLDSQDIPVDRFEKSTYHAGQFSNSQMEVNAPWYSVRVEGRKVAFILDPQGEVLDHKRMERLLGMIETN